MPGDVPGEGASISAGSCGDARARGKYRGGLLMDKDEYVGKAARRAHVGMSLHFL